MFTTFTDNSDRSFHQIFNGIKVVNAGREKTKRLLSKIGALDFVLLLVFIGITVVNMN